jgi:2-dehydropantoate 2-reductase
MGSRFGLMLKQAGNDVLLIDGWQDHIDAINEHGLKANYNGEDLTVEIPVVHQDRVPMDKKFDLIIFFTKAMQLDNMLQSVKSLIDESTRALCLLNGIGHEDVMEKYLSKSNIFLGNTMWTAGIEAPGKVKLFGQGSVDLQNLDKSKEESAKEIAEVLTKAGLNAKYADNIHYSIYKKACVNGTMNGLCTILDVNMATLGESSTAKAMCTAIVSEFVAVAKVEEVELNVEEVLAQVFGCFNPETIGMHHPSMHQDLIKNNRLTEIDYINGAVSRKGKKYNVATPYCDFLTQLVHAKEDAMGAK